MSTGASAFPVEIITKDALSFMDSEYKFNFSIPSIFALIFLNLAFFTL